MVNHVRRDFYNELLSISNDNREFYQNSYDNYYEILDNSSAKIQGKTINSIFHPYIFNEEDLNFIRNKAENFWSILDKTANLLVTEGEVQSFYDFSEDFLDLLKVNPGYPINIPITRFDAFYNGNSILFCEFNTDGTSGMNETNTMEEAFLATELGKKLQAKYSLSQFELRKSLLNTLLDCYRQFNDDQKPNIAIVDFMDKATIAEFEALKETFISCGYNTEICDIRDFTYADGKLWHGDYRVDLVYRRAVTTEILERLEHVQGFIQGYKNNAFCMVGSFRSEAAHSKLVFTFLSSKTAEKYFNEEELKVIREHIPFTFKLTSNNEEHIKEIINNKDAYLIKPHNSYGGQGLFVGKNYSQQEWEDIVHKNTDINYIGQKLIEIPEENFVAASGKTDRLKVNISPYLYNGKLQGFYTRVSNIEVITTSQGGAVVPTFLSKS